MGMRSASSIRPLVGACAPGHHGNPRAALLIRSKASKAMCGARLKLRRETVVPSSSSSREPRRDFNYVLFGSDDCYVAPEQSFDMVIGSNFKGAYFTIQKALPLLRPGSSVVINASVGARKGWPTTSTVSTCKAAVVHLARILSAELVGRGIRVNTLSPGPTDTAMFGRFAGEEQGDAVKGVLATNNPSKRMADPSEIAKLAVYLASDDSAYIVGADFLIDGGVSAISPVGA